MLRVERTYTLRYWRVHLSMCDFFAMILFRSFVFFVVVCMCVCVGVVVCVVVVVVVFFTFTDRASTIPSNIRGCQSGTWSQRGTKVNGSHHGDNPLLRPTRIQIATKSYATLQAMAPTNNKTVHQTSLPHIESSLDRLGLLSPTHDQRSQQQIGQLRSNQF